MPRRKNEFLQELVAIPYDHAQVVNTDTTIKLWVVPAGKKFRIDSVDYVNPTGLATSASNFANLKWLKGSTVMANWSTETGQQGTIAANTFVAFTLASSDADRVAAGGDVLSIFFDMTGTTTLPAGRLVVHGRYV